MVGRLGKAIRSINERRRDATKELSNMKALTIQETLALVLEHFPNATIREDVGGNICIDLDATVQVKGGQEVIVPTAD